MAITLQLTPEQEAKLRSVAGFSAESAGATTLFVSVFGGIPVSTNHTITSAIIGVGSVSRIHACQNSLCALGCCTRYCMGLNPYNSRCHTPPSTFVVHGAGNLSAVNHSLDVHEFANPG